MSAGAELVKHAFIYINNRLVGNPLETIAAMITGL